MCGAPLIGAVDSWAAQDTLFVLTDTMHKSSFKSHARILMLIYRCVSPRLCCSRLKIETMIGSAVVSGNVRVQLCPDPTVNNVAYLRQFTASLLSRLPTLTPVCCSSFDRVSPHCAANRRRSTCS